MNAQTNSFKHVAILGGGGLMGHGIALACLQGSDSAVTIISRRQESVDHGLELIHNGPFGLQKAVKRGKLTEEQVQEIKGRLRGTTDYAESLAAADLVIETIPEVVPDNQEALTPFHHWREKCFWQAIWGIQS